MKKPEAPEIPDIPVPAGVKIRYTVPQDGEALKRWLSDPSVRDAFPMDGEAEIDDAVRRWVSFSRVRSSLTIEADGKPIGLGTLYVQTYKRLLHQTEFGIILDGDYRAQGNGSYLLSSLMKFAKRQFKIELLHLQVYEKNPAIRFYERFGFREFGRQTHWIKDENKYVGRIFMERFL
jgi:RimJ/RimL family protein N-acetyltransferase